MDDSDFAPVATDWRTPPDVSDATKAAIRQMEITRVTENLRSQGLFSVPSEPTLMEMKRAQYRRDMQIFRDEGGLAFIAAWNERAAEDRVRQAPHRAERFESEAQAPLIGVA